MLVSALSGCALYSSKIREARGDIEAGRYESAIEKLKILAAKDDNDKLLYLLELGMANHASGRYAEAIESFTQADKLAELTDYTSVSQEAGSVLLNDSVKVYKGEDFEKVLISVYLAMDYLLLGKYESALVECRRVNHKLDVMIREGKLPYDRNAFAKYMAGMIFESQEEINDAFVDYRTAAKWASGFDYLGVALLRMADRLKAMQEFEAFQKEYPSVTDFKLGKKVGEVVVLVEQGKVPYKVPNPSFNLVPMFVKNSYVSRAVRVRDFGGLKSVVSAPLYNIEFTAMKELDDRTAGIIAKKIAGIAAKEAAGYGVAKATNSKELGFLTAVVLRLTDQADTRSWTTLPATLQVARLTLPVGKHDILIDNVTATGEIPNIKKFEAVDVKPGKITFLNVRMTD